MLPEFDRSESLRADGARLADALGDASACFIIFHEDRALVHPERMEPVVLRGDRLRTLGIDLQRAVLLGFDGELPWFGIDVEEETVSGWAEAGAELVALRAIDVPVASDVWGLLAQARALLAWNRSTTHCPSCGAPTAVRQGGYQRACLDPACGRVLFPRTDPAVIVRVMRNGRCLLARSHRFPSPLRSVIAGFVEPGESLEGAVHREVAEEVGLELGDVRYLGSQPWPFPTSLMIGFEATSLADDVRIDGVEIDAAGWYTRQEVREAERSGELRLPSPKSIARQMIDGWLAGRSGL